MRNEHVRLNIQYWSRFFHMINEKYLKLTWDQGPVLHCAGHRWRLQGRRPSGRSSLQYLALMTLYVPSSSGLTQRTGRVWEPVLPHDLLHSSHSPVTQLIYTIHIQKMSTNSHFLTPSIIHHSCVFKYNCMILVWKIPHGEPHLLTLVLSTPSGCRLDWWHGVWVCWRRVCGVPFCHPTSSGIQNVCTVSLQAR